MKKAYVALVFCGVSLISLINGSPVNAISIYDNAYETTDKVEVTYTGNTSYCSDKDQTPIDVTLNWSTYILDENKYLNTTPGGYYDNMLTYKSSFETALINGRWGVSQNGENVLVYWTEDTSLGLTWTETSVQTTPIHYITLTSSCWSAGGYENRVIAMPGDHNAYGLVSMPPGTKNLFVFTDYPNYPTDYEGEEIIEGIGEEPAYNAGTGLIPVSDYSVNNMDIVIKDVTSASEKILYKIDECMFQMPNNSYGDNFTEYIYDCDNPTEITHTFGDGYAGYNIIHRLHSTETDLWYESTLVLDVDGSTFSGSIGKIDLDIYEKCINENAPYLHFKDCLKAFGKITNSMSFGAIDLLGAFKYEPITDCMELGTLGNWLNLNNKEICPQFSEEVRNTVTPFVTFGLSLGVLGALLTKSRTDFM